MYFRLVTSENVRTLYEIHCVYVLVFKPTNKSEDNFKSSNRLKYIMYFNAYYF